MNFDVLIRGGTVVDGTGRPPVAADVAIQGGRIAAVGRLPSDVGAARVVDARQRIVAPGFIDAHVHSERALTGGPDRHASLLQGVTTHLTAPDGFGWAPLPAKTAGQLWRATAFAYGDSERAVDWPTVEAYLAEFESSTPLNIVPMAPHQAIRFAVKGWAEGPANAAELELMAEVTRQWMEAGAAGLNTGLDYPPVTASTTDELVALARVAGEYGGVYAAHMRYQGLGRAAAYGESITVGRQAGVPVRISHEPVDDESQPIIEEARRELDLTVDWYLYPAGSTHLLALLPPDEQVGGPDAVVARVRSQRAERSRLAALYDDQLSAAHARGAREYLAATRSGRWIGWSLAQVAAELGISLGEAAVEVLVSESPDAILIFPWGISEADFESLAVRSLRHEAFSVASDGVYHGQLPHPRGFGCFSRVLRRFVRELRAVSLTDAIRSMSALPAERYGLRDRGRAAVGLAADLVIFDAETVADRATWEEPRRSPVGVDAVLVNGVLAVDAGRPTGVLAGRVVRRG